MARDKKDN